MIFIAELIYKGKLIMFSIRKCYFETLMTLIIKYIF